MLHTADGEHTYYTVCRKHTPYDLIMGTIHTVHFHGEMQTTVHTLHTAWGTCTLMHLLAYCEDSSETSVQPSQTTSCHIPKHSILPHFVFLSLHNNLSQLPHIPLSTHSMQPVANQTYVCGPYVFSNTLNLHSPIRMTHPFLSDLVNIASTVKFSVVKGFMHIAWEHSAL